VWSRSRGAPDKVLLEFYRIAIGRESTASARDDVVVDLIAATRLAMLSRSISLVLRRFRCGSIKPRSITADDDDDDAASSSSLSSWRDSKARFADDVSENGASWRFADAWIRKRRKHPRVPEPEDARRGKSRTARKYTEANRKSAIGASVARDGLAPRHLSRVLW